jgi:PhzF family phenazine biosynthesis protein
MPVPLYQVDAFAEEAFGGNPAAVCFLDAAAPEAWMQHVAAEMNLSETAFLAPHDDGYRLRWFTPTTEVALCGHATLASAHILWEMDYLSPEDTARFHTKSGLLTARRDGEEMVLDFPATPVEAAEAPDGLADALGVDPQYVGRSRFDYLVEVADAAVVREATPDFRKLGRVEARGIIVTSRSDGEEADFVSRFFAPAAGVDEDPVTGSAHCCLAPYWSEKFGRSSLVGHQVSRRGGRVRVRVEDGRVHLGGRAVTVFRGELVADPA